MRGDKRRVKRHRMQRKAWLMTEDGQRCECMLTNISDKGAHVTTPESGTIPDTFLLLFSESGSTRRRSRVIWRKPHELGIKFETRLDERIRANHTAKPPADPADKKLKIAEDA